MKLILGLIVTTNLAVGLCGASDRAVRAKAPMPPLPPGAVIAENGKLTESPSARIARKTPQQKESVVVADNAAPGSKINEPAGADLPKKQEGDATAPK